MGSFTFSPCEYILNVSHPQPSAAAALPLGEDLHASEAISFCTPVFSSTRIFQILICYGSPLTTINCQRLADFFLLLFLVGYMFWCSFRNENRHKSLHSCKELFIFFWVFVHSGFLVFSAPYCVQWNYDFVAYLTCFIVRVIQWCLTAVYIQTKSQNLNFYYGRRKQSTLISHCPWNPHCSWHTSIFPT